MRTEDRPQWWNRVRAGARVVGVLVILVTGSALLAGRAWANELGEQAVAVGRSFEYLGGYAESEQTVTMNGAVVRMQSRTVERPLVEVLDAAHADCSSRTLQLPALLRRWSETDPVFDQTAETEGVVACFELAERDLGAIVERLQEAASTADLGRLGAFRYVYARSAGAARTAVLSLRTEGPLDLASMFPETGDAPGIDDPDVPRPEGGRRVLSVVHEELGSTPMNLYTVSADLDELRATYGERLRNRGWTIRALETPRPEPETAGNGGARNSAREEPFQGWLLQSPQRSIVVTLTSNASGETQVLTAPVPDRSGS